MKSPKGMKVLSKKTESMSKPMEYDNRPSFRVTTKDLPEIETWETGKEYILEVKVKLESYKEEAEGGPVEKCGCLRIVAIGVEEKE